MSNKNCGCNSSSSSNTKEHLLIAASAAEASTCEPKSTGGSDEAQQSCPKQEPVFDSIISGFVVPLPGNSITIPVCNASVYSPGQWIQMLNPTVRLRIASISGNNLIAVNGCPNGAEIEGNPDAGLAVNAGTRFSVVAQPLCETEEEQAAFLDNALASATEICTPSLEETGESAIVQPIGRVESDPDDTSFKKCLKRIYGFLMKGGTPSFPQMTTANLSEILSHKRVVRHTSSGDLKTIPNHSEDSRISSGKQYAIHVSPSKETLVGPVYYPTFFFKNLIQSPSDIFANRSSWPLLDSSGEFTQSFNLGNFSEISSLLKELDHYYVMCRIGISMARSADAHFTLVSYLNDVLVNNVMTNRDSSTTVVAINTTSAPIKVLTSDNNLTVKLKSSIAAPDRYFLRLDIDGIYI